MGKGSLPPIQFNGKNIPGTLMVHILDTIVVLQQTENVYTIQNNNLKNTLLHVYRIYVVKYADVATQ